MASFGIFGLVFMRSLPWSEPLNFCLFVQKHPQEVLGISIFTFYLLTCAQKE